MFLWYGTSSWWINNAPSYSRWWIGFMQHIVVWNKIIFFFFIIFKFIIELPNVLLFLLHLMQLILTASECARLPSVQTATEHKCCLPLDSLLSLSIICRLNSMIARANLLGTDYLLVWCLSMNLNAIIDTFGYIQCGIRMLLVWKFS